MLYSTEDTLVLADLKIIHKKPVNQYQELLNSYKNKLKVNKLLNRSLISFQANKTEPFYRWFKYKEGFSTTFVKYILDLFAKVFTYRKVISRK